MLQHLTDCFQEKWVGCSGPIAWSSRSPDLNPLDFYLGHYGTFEKHGVRHIG